jgi:hypothetical protein
MSNLSEYITYRSLLAKRQGKGFSESEVTSILRQILSQLTKLHDLKQAHGAISLDTVVHDSDRMHIVLLPDNWMNHPIYLAPEVEKSRQATPAADIYALGVFAIVLLTGLSPEELKTAEHEWNWEDRCVVSNRFIQMLNMALFDAYEFRYVNAGQMLRSLQPLLSSTQRKPELDDPTISAKPVIFPPPIVSATAIPFIDPVAAKLSKSQSMPPESNISDSFKDTINGEELDFRLGEIEQTNNLSSQLPDSPTYRKTGFSRDSKPPSKNRSKIVLLVFAIAIIGGIIGTYLYIQSKSNANLSKNIQTPNTSSSPSVAESEAERIKKAKKIEETTDKLLGSAKSKYESTGNVTEAKIILQEIAVSNPMRSKADRLIIQWQEDAKKNNDLINKAETAIANGNPQQAIDMLKEVSVNPHWQQRSKKISETAKQQLAKKITAPDPVIIPTIAPAPIPEPIPEPPSSAPEPIAPPPSYSAPPSQEPEPKDAPPPPRPAN